MNDRYHISTGRTNGYFTIRHTYDEVVWSKDEAGNPVSRLERKDYYVRSLGNKPETAKANLAKWQAETGLSVSNPEYLSEAPRDITRGGGETFPFGKHLGKTPQQVFDSGDSGYLVWILPKLNPKKHVTLTREIDRLVGDKVRAAEAAEEAAQSWEVEQGRSIARENAWLIDVLLQGNEWLQGIAHELGAGWLAFDRLSAEELLKGSAEAREARWSSGYAQYSSPAYAAAIGRWGQPFDVFPDGSSRRNHNLPRTQGSLPLRLVNILQDAYAKQVGGRRGSKAYDEAASQFIERLSGGAQ